MNKKLEILRGVHPGVFLERELKKRGLSKVHFARAIGAYPQTLSAIMGGKRNMNTSLSMLIEKELGLEEGFLMILQVFYDIKTEKQKQSEQHHPDLSKFRPALFWDTRLENIDWKRQKQAVIRRVFDRGRLSEKKEILHFYGQEIIRKVLAS